MKTFQEFILECYELEESSSYVILEVRRPESGSPEEQARWDRQKARQDALDNPSSKIIGIIGRDKKGIQRYGLKDAERRRQQGKNRSSRLTDIDSDLDPEKKKRGDKKASLIGSGNRNASPPIQGRGKEVHHLTKIADSAKEFEGLSPEERKAKREKDAEGGKFHGSDPRNIAQTDGPEGGTGIPHRGEGGYHSRQKPVGKGGSIQDFGSEKEIVAVKKGRERRGYIELERFAREKGIETPRMQKQRELRARMSANAKARGFS
jgi:hypothetical protein